MSSASRFRQLLAASIGGEEARAEFTALWMQGGRFPGARITKRWPNLNTGEPSRIAEYWGLPAPHELPQIKRSGLNGNKPIAVDQLVERVWELIEPRITAKIETMLDSYTTPQRAVSMLTTHRA